MWCNKATKWIRAADVLVLSLMIVSCTTGPDYDRPGMDLPEGFKSAGGNAADPGLGLDWWRLFNDPELDALAEEALASNLDLQAAMARVAQARASALSVKSAFFPVVTLDPSASRARTPDLSEDSGENGLSEAASTLGQIANIANQIDSIAQGGAAGGVPQTGGSETGVDSPSNTNASYRVPFDVSYEIDVWGRVRRSYESAQAQAQASLYGLEVVRQTLLADLVRDYFDLRSFDAQYQILERNLDLYQEQVNLTESQYKAGLIDETNLLQAQVQLESTSAQAADVQRQRMDLEHAIALLLGRAPAEFSLGVRPLDTAPPVIPAGLPSDLLRRRPDVAQSEQNLVAACAEIGVAEAEFYPSINLTGSAGFQSAEFEDVLNWKNRAWSVGPNISLPIFKGRQLRANLDKAKARFDELDATYRNDVLVAFGEVEDALTDVHMRAQAAEAQAKAVAAAREYLRLIHLQYQTGVTDYLHVVNAEQTLLSNEIAEAQLLNQRMTSTVRLIKALGGGWDVSTFDSPPESAQG